MITDDEVMRLFERADPARDDDGASVIDVTGYLDALRTRSSYVATVEINPTRTGPPSRHRWRLVAAVAAAAALVVGGALALAATRDDAAGPVTDTPENPPLDATVERVATGFLAAVGAFDADRAITYLADDADLSEMGASTPHEFRMLVSWLEAQGYHQFVDSCEGGAGSASGISLRCPFAFQALRSDEIGLGPFRGSSFELTVRDGEIVRASQNLETREFSPQVWEPFAAWVSTAHPEDAAVMYEDETLHTERHTAASIRLWEQHTREYAAAQTAEVVGIAEDFMAARNAHDIETALSMVSDDGVEAQLCDQSVMPRYACVNDVATEPVMGHVRLNHDAVALAFEAERLYGVRYRSYACEKDSGSYVTCTYRFDSTAAPHRRPPTGRGGLQPQHRGWPDPPARLPVAEHRLQPRGLQPHGGRTLRPVARARPSRGAGRRPARGPGRTRVPHAGSGVGPRPDPGVARPPGRLPRRVRGHRSSADAGGRVRDRHPVLAHGLWDLPTGRGRSSSSKPAPSSTGRSGRSSTRSASTPEYKGRAGWALLGL